MEPFVPNSLPLESLDWASFVPLIGQAHAALGRYRGVLEGIPNPALLLSPLATQEALLSSRIEGTVATLQEVLEFEAAPPAGMKTERRDELQEIINYRVAMRMAVEQMDAKPLSLNLVKHIHLVLLDSVRGKDKARGEFRTRQNWIGRPDSRIEEAAFVPPEPSAIERHLSNWEKYVHYDEKDRLVQLAVVHAQFELIHPFLDGNGRTGRILIPLFLHQKGLLSGPMFYISAYLDAHRDAYIDRLSAISAEGDWDAWIRFFLEAVTEQATANSDKARAILRLYDEMKVEIVETTHSQFAIQALDALFREPIFTTPEFIKRSSIPDQSARRILGVLQHCGVLSVLVEARGRQAGVLMFPKFLAMAEGRVD